MNSAKHLRFIIENLQGLVCTHDMRGNILAVNHASAESLQALPDDIIGKNLRDIVAPAFREQFSHYLLNIAQHKITEGVMCIVNRNGDYRYWKFRNIRIDEEGKESFVIGCSQDVTDHILLEKELKKARLEAEELGKAKEQFLANMSHEIRTPMNAIMGFSELLLSTQLNDLQKEYIRAINTSSKNLLTIINDILDLSKIRAGKMTFEKVRFELPEVLKSIQMLLQAKARDKGIELKVSIDDDVPAALVGDSIRLNQILLNIAGNAVKFTDQGSVQIHVSLQKRNKSGLWLVFSVKDTGIGIPKNKLSSVFESFSQAGSHITRQYGGTGLGLSITRQLVEMQKGTIAVRSRKGKGSEFIITLKYKEGRQKAAVAKLPILASGKKAVSNILLVEDNKLNQQLALAVLNDKGFIIDLAENGKEAIEKVRTNNYDLVLMDVRMPVMDGYKATRYIRKHLPMPQRNVPIIALTANAAQAEVDKCRNAGMNDYMAKPFEQKVLFDKINRLTQINVDEPLLTRQHEGNKPYKFRYINLAYLQAAANGKRAFITDMIKLFLKETPPAIALMNEQLQKEQWKQLEDNAHKLKSSYETIGASQSTEYTQQIEGKSRKHELDAVRRLMQKLNKDLPLIMEELKRNLTI